jgi:hypothetical protein
MDGGTEPTGQFFVPDKNCISAIHGGQMYLRRLCVVAALVHSLVFIEPAPKRTQLNIAGEKLWP